MWPVVSQVLERVPILHSDGEIELRTKSPNPEVLSTKVVEREYLEASKLCVSPRPRPQAYPYVSGWPFTSLSPSSEESFFSWVDWNSVFFNTNFYYAYISNVFKATKIMTYGSIFQILILCVSLARISLSILFLTSWSSSSVHIPIPGGHQNLQGWARLSLAPCVLNNTLLPHI